MYRLLLPSVSAAGRQVDSSLFLYLFAHEFSMFLF
jgi:hypothetical protein